MNVKNTLQKASLVALSAMLIIGCKKPKPNVVPEPDTEFQSSKDAVWATNAIADIENMCSCMGENMLLDHFYKEIPGTSVGVQGTVTTTRDANDQYLNMGFFKTQCVDGHFRENTVFMRIDGFSQAEKDAYIPRHQPDSKYAHSYGFGGFITLSDYKVDGWKIETVDGTPAVFTNEMTDKGYDPATTQLKWKLKGKFKFTHPTDASQDMIWEGELVKTCLNSTDKNVFNATKDHKADGYIQWRKAKVSYSGIINGVASGNVPYKMEIKEGNALVRDFTCYPYEVGGISLNGANKIDIRKQEMHPFVIGIAQLTTTNSKGEDSYPRQLYFGNEGNPELNWQCDNSGEIYIKGITYKIDFTN